MLLHRVAHQLDDPAAHHSQLDVLGDGHIGKHREVKRSGVGVVLVVSKRRLDRAEALALEQPRHRLFGAARVEQPHEQLRRGHHSRPRVRFRIRGIGEGRGCFVLGENVAQDHLRHWCEDAVER